MAAKYSEDIDSYIEGKTDFILSVLEKYSVQAADERDVLKRANNKVKIK